MKDLLYLVFLINETNYFQPYHQHFLLSNNRTFIINVNYLFPQYQLTAYVDLEFIYEMIKDMEKGRLEYQDIHLDGIPFFFVEGNSVILKCSPYFYSRKE